MLFRSDGFLAGRIEPGFLKMILQRIRSVLCDLLESVFELFVGEGAPLREEFAKVAQDLFDGSNVLLVAVYQQLIAPCADVNVEE